jgi:phenylacetic acid degradation operon negative regulatory protein
MEPLGTTRPLAARSVIASTLLGMHPPRLSGQLLVRSGELFGIAEGATRTAMSRMVAGGELELDGDAYRLAGSLLARQERQDASRVPAQRAWNGSWEIAVVVADRRPAAARNDLRVAMRRLKLAERREGVWMRPDNLPSDRGSADRAVVERQCQIFHGAPAGSARSLAATLWDLDAWARGARELSIELDRYRSLLERGDASVLRDGFVLSAAVLRHLLADPLLPAELVADDWPGDELRVRYEGYDAVFKDLWRTWFRNQRT